MTFTMPRPGGWRPCPQLRATPCRVRVAPPKNYREMLQVLRAHARTMTLTTPRSGGWRPCPHLRATPCRVRIAPPKDYREIFLALCEFMPEP